MTAYHDLGVRTESDTEQFEHQSWSPGRFGNTHKGKFVDTCPAFVTDFLNVTTSITTTAITTTITREQEQKHFKKPDKVAFLKKARLYNLKLFLSSDKLTLFHVKCWTEWEKSPNSYSVVSHCVIYNIWKCHCYIKMSLISIKIAHVHPLIQIIRL